MTAQLRRQTVINVYQSEARKYLEKQNWIEEKYFNMVDWETLHRALSDKSTSFCNWYTKHTTGFGSIGKIMEKRRLWNNSLCRCCLKIQEKDADHMLRCSNMEIQVKRTQVYTSIFDWLKEVDTDPDIVIALKSFLEKGVWDSSWLVDLLPHEAKCVIELQNIGKKGLLHGYIPISICEWQHDFYISINSRRRGTSWGKMLVTKLLEAKHDLWKLRCVITHDKGTGGLYAEELRELKKTVKRELDRGMENISRKDKFLLKENMETLFGKPISYVRSWLVDIYLARGEMISMDQEIKNTRSSLLHKRKNKDHTDILVSRSLRAKRQRASKNGNGENRISD